MANAMANALVSIIEVNQRQARLVPGRICDHRQIMSELASEQLLNGTSARGKPFDAIND